MIRRLKSEVLSYLPSKVRQKVHVNTDPAMMNQVQDALVEMLMKVHDALGRQFTHDCRQNQLVTTLKHKLFGDMKDSSDQTLNDVDTCVQDMIKNVDKDYINKSNLFNRQSNVTDDRVVSSVLKLWDLTGQAKLPGIKAYITDLISGGVKFLIFAHHLPVLDAIEDQVIKLKVKYIRIDGRTPNYERHNLVRFFQESDECRIAVLSITAANQGLTLTAANLVVFAEMHWTPGVLVQAEDRIHRIGQKYSVNIHYLFAKATLDNTMYTRLIQKLIVVGTALDGKAHKLDATNIELENGKQTMGRTDSKCESKAVTDIETKLVSKSGKQVEGNAMKKINNSIGFKTMNLKSFFAVDKKQRVDANGNKAEKNEKNEKSEKTEKQEKVEKKEKTEEVKKE